MNCNATVKKLIQISEETQPPVHVPVVLGNECFIVTQQDLRRIEDIRLLSYSKLLPNGEIIPMETLGHDVSIRDAILNAGKYRMQLDQNPELTNTNMLLEFIKKVLCYPQQMDTNAIAQQPIATLEQQLQWAKAFNDTNLAISSPPLPQNYLYAAPTTDNNLQSITYGCNCSCGNNNNSSNGNNNRCCSRGSNTMDTDDSQNNTDSAGTLSAREQLKQKKVAQEFT